jgi:hypothetical protein
MKNLLRNSKAASAVLAVVVMALFTTTLYSQQQDSKKVYPKAVDQIIKSEKALKNLEMALNSDNPGLKMSAINLIGKYKITAFENQLTEKLYNSEKCKEQMALAVSLYHLGTISSIATLIDYGEITDNENMKAFCGELIAHYEKEELAKAKYVNSLVIDTEFSE